MNRCCATKLLFRQIYLLVFTCVPEGAGILGEDAPGRSFYRNKVHQTQKATSKDVALIALAGSTGLEPATSDVTGRRSNQTELTPQADVRVCFRSRALRGLVYTEVCPARNNFFEKISRSCQLWTFQQKSAHTFVSTYKCVGKNLASQEMLSAIFRISSRGIFPMIVCDMPSFSHTSTYLERPPLLFVPSVASAVPT